MRHILVILVFLCSWQLTEAQVTGKERQQTGQQQQQGQGQDGAPLPRGQQAAAGVGSSQTTVEKPPIADYKIMTVERDTTTADTTLNIYKRYRFNYLRRDNFGLLPFNNVGQGYNRLTYDFDELRLMPQFGARGRHFNFMEIEDIHYYLVPTPLTDLYYKTAFQQGQQMDAFFTINLSEHFNFSIAYKGLRSLGRYQNALTSTGNFRFSTHYHSPNDRYRLRTHVVFQDLMNQENGGVHDDYIHFFTEDDDEFSDRGRLEVNFQDADNKLEGRRFFLDQDYALLHQQDSSTHTILRVGNTTVFENRYFHYGQDNPFEGYGATYGATKLRDKVKLESLTTRAYADFDNHIIGNLSVFTGYSHFNYGYNTVLFLHDQTITNRLVGSVVEVGAAYRKYYRGFELLGKTGLNVSGDFEGNYLLGQASYRLNEGNRARATVQINSNAPNYNFLLYQSEYVNYNWQTAFRNEKKQQLQFELESDVLFNASVTYTGIDDYAYFARSEDTGTTRPFQHNGRVDYLKLEVQRAFSYGKFGWEGRFLYQNVLDGQGVFNVPEFLGRSSIFFTDRIFKNAMQLQTGFTGTYFTDYYMNGYDPVLAEFYVQNNQRFGNFPLVDFFLDAKISQTRLYFTLEHFNSLFGKKNYFSAPNYPYRDFAIRFGIVWNFFL